MTLQYYAKRQWFWNSVQQGFAQKSDYINLKKLKFYKRGNGKGVLYNSVNARCGFDRTLS
jgi:hypothetical protein